MIIHRHFLSVYIPCRNIALMLSVLWYVKHFSMMLFCYVLKRPKYVYFDDNNMVVL